jgi:hypothetical protein
MFEKLSLHAVRRAWPLITVLAILPAGPSRANAQQGSAVVPGITIHYEHARAIDTIVYRRSVTRGGQDSVSGTRTVVVRHVDQAGGLPLLEVTQRFPGGGGEIVDTAVAELGTLRAVSHSSHQPAKTMHFTFGASDADGTVNSKAAAPGAAPQVESVHQQLGGAIFDSNVIELVVASLPLRANFTADLPFFIYERGGRVRMPVAVRERSKLASPLGERDAWVVSVGVPDAPATVWVDTQTHAVLRVRYDIASRGMSFTDDRVTPLRL